MIGLFLALLGIGVLVLAVYFGGLIVLRQSRGRRWERLYNAGGQVILAVCLDIAVLVFSVSFCTTSMREALRLREAGIPNRLIDELTRRLGTGPIEMASLWGVVLPAVSWVLAHFVIYGLLLTVRLVYAGIQARAEIVREWGAEELAGRPLEPNWLWGIAAFVVSCLFGVAFYMVVSLDSLLIRYQMISSSRPIKMALGDNWEQLPYGEMVSVLKGSFLGQIVLHAGAFYVLALLVAAFCIVIALHNISAAIHALPVRRPGGGGPPPLPPEDPPSWRQRNAEATPSAPAVNIPPPGE